LVVLRFQAGMGYSQNIGEFDAFNASNSSGWYYTAVPPQGRFNWHLQDDSFVGFLRLRMDRILVFWEQSAWLTGKKSESK